MWCLCFIRMGISLPASKNEFLFHSSYKPFGKGFSKKDENGLACALFPMH